jgi:hypothetical protein
LIEMFFKNSPDWSTVEPIKFNILLYPAVFSLECWKPQVSSSLRSWVIQKTVGRTIFWNGQYIIHFVHLTTKHDWLITNLFYHLESQ